MSTADIDLKTSRPEEGLSQIPRAQHFEEGKKLELELLLRITRMGFAYKYRITIALFATTAASIFQLFIPRYIGDAVDVAHGLLALEAVTYSDVENALWHAAVMIVFLSIIRGLFTVLQNYQGEAIGHCIGYELRIAFYEKIQKLSFGFHDKVHTGDLITRGMLDLEGVRMFISTGIVRLVMLIVLIIGATILMLKTDLILTFLALSFVPFVGWRSSAARLKLRWMWLLMQERLGVLTRLMEENLTGIRVVRAFTAQLHELEKFDIASTDVLKVALKRVHVRVSSTTSMSFAFFIAMMFVLWIGGHKVIDGQISVGRLTEFLAFMTILQMPVRQIGMLVNSFARASTCGTRLFEVIDRQSTVLEVSNPPELEIGNGILEFKNVTFRFPEQPKGQNILSDINFSVGPGETLGIVGPPGAGKSTIAHLIPRFYDAVAGSIFINGQDIQTVSIESLRRFVSVVQQDPYLFTASIENNIAYGDPWAGDSRVAEANRSAQLHNYVEKLPIGYRTLIGERGVSLSGGQRQRLSIARGLMLEPGIIIFDDSTASIDTATERRIRSSIKKDSKNRVTIIISHRLGSLIHANEILFVEDGNVTERGTHKTLLARKGRYYELFQLQTQSGLDHGIVATEEGAPSDTPN